METERRLREAFGEVAESARPDMLRPLTLPPRGRRVWLVPAITALAVAICIGISVRAMGHSAPGRVAAGEAPAFVVAASDHLARGYTQVEVREAGTGRVFDQRRSPEGRSFEYVAAAGDNRTFFVLSAPVKQTACNTIRIYRLTIGDTGRIGTFAPVGPPIEGGTEAGSAGQSLGRLAVSQDGGRLAYSVTRCDPLTSIPLFKIGVIDIVAGVWREWTEPQHGNISNLSWRPDSRGLVFLHRTNPRLRDTGGFTYRDGTVRLLDTRSESASLLSAKVLARESAGLPHFWAAVSNGDKGAITVVAEDEPVDGHLVVAELPAGGRPRVLHKEPRPTPSDSHFGVVLKSDTSGRHLLYQPEKGRAGSIDDGLYSALPSPAGQADDLAW